MSLFKGKIAAYVVLKIAFDSVHLEAFASLVTPWDSCNDRYSIDWTVLWD